MTTFLSVLLFDPYLLLPPEQQDQLKAAGVELDITTAVDPITRYHPDSRSLTKATFADQGDWDAIVVGHNLGAGLIIATVLPAPVLDRTMIVWDDHQPRREAPYAKMGYTRFGNRPMHAGPTQENLVTFLLERAAAKASRRTP